MKPNFPVSPGASRGGFLKGVFILLLAALIYSGGFLHGRTVKSISQPATNFINRQLSQPQGIDFSLFWDVYQKVSDEYFGTIDAQKYLYGAIAGGLNSLGDPYTSFLDPQATKDFEQDLSGEFEGIGAELVVRDGKLTIIAPLDGSPAQKAGLKAKDEILQIDSAPVGQMTFSEAVSKIRGQGGTKVKLQISREGWDKPRDFTITRAKITVKSVTWNWKEGNILYLKISQFGEDTNDLVKQVLAEAKKKKTAKAIIDLRDDPGGLLTTAIDVTSYFIPKGKIVSEVDKDNKKQEYQSSQEQQFFGQIVVLVNGGSASGSEIMAGAIQDGKFGQLVGEKTFGKGSVQSYEKLKDDSSLRVTVAKWYTPSGRLINGEGIKPDIEVKLTEDDEKAGRDPQMDKALELISH